MSKAFNRVDHSLLVLDLYDMHTPAWLLRIIISYLSNRSMYLTYMGAQSTEKLLPGGGPQGAYLGGIIFMIKYNGAFLRPPIPRPLQGPVSKAKAQKVKFIDDGTIAVSIDLKASLVTDPVTRPRPHNYDERSCLVLPHKNNLLHYYLRDAEEFASVNKMVVNKEKTKIMSFNKSRKWVFPTELEFSDGTKMGTMAETKLLGIIISDNLKWHKNTQYICDKARQKLWMLRRLLKLKLSHQELFDVYIKEVRSILELAVPVWHSGLTIKQSNQIESIQKIAFKMILQNDYTSYSEACEKFSTISLKERRIKLCLRFAKKNFKSDFNMFTKNQTKIHNTRYSTKPVLEPRCNTGRYQKSSLPFLARLLNSQVKK